MRRHGIPTSPFGVFRDVGAAEAYIASRQGRRVVVKASGLAAGKGVLLPETPEAAVEAVKAMLCGDAFGSAGAEVVVEEHVQGEEVSLFALCDGAHALPMVPAQDHKRIHEFNQGANTGGMGAIAPSPLVDGATYQAIVDRVMLPAVRGMAEEGHPFVGVLFAGLMLGPSPGHGQPRSISVLEFNVRFGDPETQVVLPLLSPKTDFARVLLAATQGSLPSAGLSFATQLPGITAPPAGCVRIAGVDWRGASQHAATVVAVSRGYPAAYAKGLPLTLPPPEALAKGCSTIHHAGTAWHGEQLVTAGGRVLAATSVADSLSLAVRHSYHTLRGVHFEGMTFRRDIGGKPIAQELRRHRAALAGGACSLRAAADLAWHRKPGPVRVGVLGSTNGSDMVELAKLMQPGCLLHGKAAIVQVISNRSSAGIVQNAEAAGLPVAVIPSKGKSREAFDAEVADVLEAADVDVVLLIGFMRIVSPVLVRRFMWRLLNVHPSLLPKFGGGMDCDVHQAVLDAGEHVTGCTVHFVDTGVDTGAILTQRTVPVLPGDDAAALKQRVQVAEVEALADAILLFGDGSPLLTTILERGDGQFSAELLSLLPAGALPPGIARNPPCLDAKQAGLTYAAAGVDIEAGAALVDLIKPLVKSTQRSGADGSVGGFGGVFDLAAAGYSDPLLVSGTDGVGTKLTVAGIAGVHDTIGIDGVAMCVNDILSQGAEPLFFLDYFATGHLDPTDAAAVVAGVAAGCRESGCALLGGETAEMPGMYGPGEYDIAGFAVGAVERGRLLPKTDAMRPGDVLLGLASSGVHSNGFSLVRSIVDSCGAAWYAPCPFATTSAPEGATLAQALLAPTRLYVKPVLAALRSPLGAGIKGLAHITGGGLPENLPRTLPASLLAEIQTGSWPVPPVFKWLQVAGSVQEAEMFRTFNMGVGMVVVAAAEAATGLADLLAASGQEVSVIGKLVPRGEANEPVRFV